MGLNLEGFARRKTDINIGGKDWTFAELSIIDLVSFKVWLVAKKEISVKARRKQLLADAKDIGNVNTIDLLKLAESEITDEEFDSQMYSIEGLAYLAWLSLKYTYPDATQDDAARLVTVDKLPLVTEAMFSLESKKKAVTTAILAEKADE